MRLLSKNQAQAIFNAMPYEKYSVALADATWVDQHYAYVLRNDDWCPSWLQEYYDNLIVTTRVLFEEPV